MAKQKTRKRKLNDQDKVEFLEVLLETGGTVLDACEAIGFDPVTLYRHRDKDPAFKAAWEEAFIISVGVLEKAAISRAVQGVEKETYDKEGNLVSTETKYSDTLLIFLLKGRNPERYKDRVQQEHSGTIEYKTDEEERLFLKERLEKFEQVHAILTLGEHEYEDITPVKKK